VDFADIADGSRPDVFDGGAAIVGGATLVPIWVATLVSFARRESLRASSIDQQSGF